MDLASQHPIFGPEIQCPHCYAPIPALTLTDSYLCTRHGAFEANSDTRELVHLQSGRHWRYWEQKWYRQHTHPDGIRFEIHEALDRLYMEGYRAIKVTIAHRYQELMIGYLEEVRALHKKQEQKSLRLYGIPIEFSDPHNKDPRWNVINFVLDKEPGVPKDYPYYQLFE